MNDDCIRLGQSAIARTECSRKLEWLETNGLGGYASGTVAGIHTRRYHGLLVAATQPPVGRIVLLSKIEEALIVNGERFEFSSNDYPGAVHPRGAQYLCEFRLDPFPTFIYQMGGVELEKRIFMVHGENATVIEYELRCLDHDPMPQCHLECRPLIAGRDYHATTHRNEAVNADFTSANGTVTLQPYPSLPSLHISHTPACVEKMGHWYHDFEFAIERERGLDSREDLFNPFLLRFDLTSTPSAAIVASTKPANADRSRIARDLERKRREDLANSVDPDNALLRRLAIAADQFIVSRGEGKTIIAGYHWFSDWGRDTMIALPGLTLTTGRFDVARHILATFAESIDRGMLPNRFPDYGEAPEYNTVDATLWYFEAVRAYLAYTGDYHFVRVRLYSRLKEILNWHLCGTRYGIRMDNDALLACGEDGMQLTWMDAKVGDWVVTPRTGKPVEIQALWYNALCIMQDLASRFDDKDVEVLVRDIAATARVSFNERFWNADLGCLHDVVDDVGVDGSIRPNQIFAVSLHHSILEPDRARRVVEIVRRELLTPLGLRTLAPQDPRYRSRYEGGVTERDGSYHQGTGWPWLLGPFLSAFVKVHDHSIRSTQQAALWLKGIEEHMVQAGLGQISEIADADYPHHPRGCMAQAWSVAELLRAAMEDIFVTQQNSGITTANERISSAA